MHIWLLLLHAGPDQAGPRMASIGHALLLHGQCSLFLPCHAGLSAPDAHLAVSDRTLHYGGPWRLTATATGAVPGTARGELPLPWTECETPTRDTADQGSNGPNQPLTKTDQNLPRHTKTHQDTPRHTKTYHDRSYNSVGFVQPPGSRLGINPIMEPVRPQPGLAPAGGEGRRVDLDYIRSTLAFRSSGWLCNLCSWRLGLTRVEALEAGIDNYLGIVNYEVDGGKV
jgi:hypothetical protein